MASFDIDRGAPAVGQAEIIVNAPPAAVWSVLTAFDDWPRWNGAIQSMQMDGPLAVGTTFRWRTGGMKIRSQIAVLAAPEVIGWTGVAPLITARHLYQLTDLAGRTKVRTRESFSGLFARLLPGMARQMMEKALEDGLALLKTECERRQPPTGRLPDAA
ncbi:MAG: SRPBCC domain-containing protein [Roseivivax sp.]|nr:SRPBCC domain-containing protein [Roseivivax sp.]